MVNYLAVTMCAFSLILMQLECQAVCDLCPLRRATCPRAGLYQPEIRTANGLHHMTKTVLATGCCNWLGTTPIPFPLSCQRGSPIQLFFSTCSLMVM